MEQIRDFLNFGLIPGPAGADITVGKLLAVLTLLVIGYLFSRLIGYVLAKRLANTRINADVIHVIRRVAFLTLIVLVILTALSLLGVPLTAFAFATGAIAIGVGFGAQNIINNFISGWILMAERPIRIGDFVEMDTTYGVVEQIGTRSTRIRRVDGVHLLVPNSQLLERTVVNWTLVDREIRTMIRVGVEYGSPVRRVSELILEAVNAQPEVKEHPAATVVFDDFGDNALIFDTYFWCDVGGEKLLRNIRSDIRFRITDLFEADGIVIAFPQRDVHLDVNGPLPVRVLDANDA